MNLIQYINSLNERPVITSIKELTDKEFINYAKRKALINKTINKTIVTKQKRIVNNNHLISKQEQTYITRAIKKGLLYTISSDEFLSLVSGICVYCGDRATGIDRIDSLQGYIISNCQSCCGTCNMMKLRMSHDMFLKHISKIYINSIHFTST